MDENLDEIMNRVERTNQERMSVLDKLFATARVDAVFSAPFTQGDRTIITAAEVGAGGGLAQAWVSDRGQGAAREAAEGQPPPMVRVLTPKRRGLAVVVEAAGAGRWGALWLP